MFGSAVSFRKHLGLIILDKRHDGKGFTISFNPHSDVYGNKVIMKDYNYGTHIDEETWKASLIHELAHVWWNHDNLKDSYERELGISYKIPNWLDGLCVGNYNPGAEEPPSTFAKLWNSYEDFADSVRCLMLPTNASYCDTSRTIGPKRKAFIEKAAKN